MSFSLKHNPAYVILESLLFMMIHLLRYATGARGVEEAVGWSVGRHSPRQRLSSVRPHDLSQRGAYPG